MLRRGGDFVEIAVNERGQKGLHYLIHGIIPPGGSQTAKNIKTTAPWQPQALGDKTITFITCADPT